MTDEMMKAACVRAAATLVAAWWPIIRNPDTAAEFAQTELNGNAMRCAELAGLLYTEVSGIDRRVKQKAAPRGGGF
jgi:hypothetical protein